MIDADELNVWYRQRLVGYLWRDRQGELGFRYENTWLADGFRLSVQLPLRAELYEPHDGRARFFFSNLLPEGEARRRLVRARRITDDDFTLLREFGGDCAGAFSILPAEASPAVEAHYALLSEEELYRLVLQRAWGAYARTGDPDKPRLSLAGAQDKCPITLLDGRYGLPQAAAASSHIIKSL